MEYVFFKMKKAYLTLLFLWEEYKEKHANGSIKDESVNHAFRT